MLADSGHAPFELLTFVFTLCCHRNRDLHHGLLGHSLGAVKGWAAAELEPVYARARELCTQIRDPALAFPALFGQWVMRWWKLEVRDALELADEILAAAEQAKEPAMLLSGNWARGTTLFHLGELVSANEHQERALAVFDLRQTLPAHLELRRVSSFAYLYYGQYELGYPDRAWAKSVEMLEVAQRSSDPYVLATAPCFVAQFSFFRGDGTAAQKRAEEALAFIETFGFQSLSPLTTTIHGAALIVQGR